LFVPLIAPAGVCYLIPFTDVTIKRDYAYLAVGTCLNALGYYSVFVACNVLEIPAYFSKAKLALILVAYCACDVWFAIYLLWYVQPDAQHIGMPWGFTVVFSALKVTFTAIVAYRVVYHVKKAQTGITMTFREFVWRSLPFVPAV
jgi:hypothetical protein